MTKSRSDKYGPGSPYDMAATAAREARARGEDPARAFEAAAYRDLAGFSTDYRAMNLAVVPRDRLAYVLRWRREAAFYGWRDWYIAAEDGAW